MKPLHEMTLNEQTLMPQDWLRRRLTRWGATVTRRDGGDLVEGGASEMRDCGDDLLDHGGLARASSELAAVGPRPVGLDEDLSRGEHERKIAIACTEPLDVRAHGVVADMLGIDPSGVIVSIAAER